MGVTPDYAVGVWCGNADGHGVAGMTGAKTAGPVLFDLLNLLPPTADWFEEPLDGGVWLDVCKESGMLRSQDCPDYERVLLPALAQESEVCPYHKDGTFRLPPAMQLDGSEGGAVFQAVHRDPSATLYWHLDDTYLGETRLIHQMLLSPAPGKHTVIVVDGDGNSVSVGFTVK